MNPEIDKHLELAINITLDVMSKANLLGAALSYWSQQSEYGYIAGSEDAAHEIREAAFQIEENLSSLRGHLNKAKAKGECGE